MAHAMLQADTLVFAGTSDALGVPRVYCACPVCADARQGGVNRRTRCSALVRSAGSVLWLDCSPDWRHQMEALGMRTAEEVLLTHPHHDHIGGIPDLADMARWMGMTVSVWGPEDVLNVVFDRYPWTSRRLKPRPLCKEVDLLGYTVRHWSVNHGRNGTSYAYRFSKSGYEWVYCPDSIDLTPEQTEPLRGLDLLVLGTAHYREDAPFASRSLYDMVEAIELVDEVKPRRTIFTHFSHGVDLRKTYPLPETVTLAADGLCVPLQSAQGQG